MNVLPLELPRFLPQKGCGFQEKVVDQDPEAMEELAARTGRKATPVVLVGGEVVVGFNRGRLQKLLNA